MSIPDKIIDPLINGAFTIMGVVLGIFGTLWTAKRTKDTKSLTLLSSPLARLLVIGDLIKNRVKILYGDKPVETLFMGEFAVQNSGTLAVESVKIDFRAADESSILGFQVGSANFQLPEKRLKIEERGSILDVRIEFLNPGERVSFSYLSTGLEKKPIIDLSQPGLNIKMQPEMVTWIPDIYAEVIFGMIKEFWWLDWIFQKNKVYKLYRDSKRNKPIKH